ncbi:hypothetical protein ACOMHN_056826 [Nucella lapillus]
MVMEKVALQKCACFREDVEAAKESSGNFFTTKDDNDSSDDSNAGAEPDSGKTEENQQADTVPKLPTPFLQSKLPSPHLNPEERKSSSPFPGPTSSVFVNPFAQAELAKLGILEKHVRLTEAAPKKPASKQVCFKFKKGKCFLGEKCRFFHDRSNIALGSGSDRTAAAGESASPEPDHPVGAGFGRGDRSFQFSGFGGAPEIGGDGQFYHPVAHFSRGQPAEPQVIDDDNYMAAAKRKKRHGVTDSLQPPKRAMEDLGSLRKQERPWTMKKQS